MVELERLAFLDVRLVGDGVQFGSGLPQVTPACRYLRDARYAFSDECAEGFEELYYMYRNVARCEDRPTIQRHGLRYDITLIPPGMIGQEYNKTVGHYHPIKSGAKHTYPEVYEVLHGEATYLLQRPSSLKGEVDDVVAVVAGAGDKVVIPPGYGHITINAGAVPLLMANWVAAEFDSVYGDIKDLKGGAYYLVNGGRAPEWINNHRYIKAPIIRTIETIDYPEFGLRRGEPMYKLIIEAPEKLMFLTHPEDYLWAEDSGWREVAATRAT